MNALEKTKAKAVAEVARILRNAELEIQEVMENLSVDSYDYGVEDGENEAKKVIE